MPYIVRYDNEKVIFVKRSSHDGVSMILPNAFYSLIYILTEGNSDYMDEIGEYETN